MTRADPSPSRGAGSHGGPADAAEAFDDLVLDLARARTSTDVAQAISRHAATALGATSCTVVISEAGTSTARLFVPHGSEHRDRDAPLVVEADASSPALEALATGTAVTVADRDDLARRYPARATEVSADGVQSCAGVLVASGDRGRAALGIDWNTPGGSLHDRRTRSVLALCGAAIERAWATELSEQIAALMATLVHEAPVGFAFVNRDLEISMINQQLAQLDGVSVEDHTGRPLRELLPDLAATSIPIIEDVLATTTSRTGVEQTVRAPGRPGGERSWELSYYPVIGAEGMALGVGIVAVDISDRKAREEELKQFNAHQQTLAVELQRGLLPDRLPTIGGYEVEVRYLAAADGLQVGGDWYEIIEVAPDDYAIVIGDVVGHDLEAAMAMSRVRNALSGLSHGHRDPTEVLRSLDHYAKGAAGVFGSSLFYGRLDPSTGTLTYSNAGHLPPMLLSEGEAPRVLDGGRGPITGLDGPRAADTIQLAEGDTLVGYTDGLVERRNEAIDVGLARLAAASANPPQTLAALTDRLIEQVPDERRGDDIAILALRRTRATEPGAISPRRASASL